jgi:hypothetical protein
MSKSVFCLSDNESQTERIVQELRLRAFPTMISQSCSLTNQGRRILLTNSTRRLRCLQEQAPGSCRRSFGMASGYRALAIPGVGPFIAARPIMAAWLVQVWVLPTGG